MHAKNLFNLNYLRRCLLLGVFLVCIGIPWASAEASPAFYTSSNAATNNQIIRYQMGSDGLFSEMGRFETGGMGTGRNLQAANSLALSDDRKWLVTVNAGSNQISAFRLGLGDPRLTEVHHSGGTLPLSVALRGRRVYVLNSGSDDVASFRLTETGRLVPLGDGAVRSLSTANTRATSLGVTADGRHLVIAERGTDRLTAFAIGHKGVLAQEAQTIETTAKLPYALSFLGKATYTIFAGQGDGQSAIGAYRFDSKGVLNPLEEPVYSGQTAACWSALSPRRRLLYAANAGSHSLTGLRIMRNGRLRFLDPNGVSVDTGPNNHPRDMAFSRDGKTLAVILSGEHAMGLYRVGLDGHLKLQQTVTGIPDATTGLVAK
jgi:6-phosphogluconolactonase (cycloisomerase 2 family)